MQELEKLNKFQNRSTAKVCRNQVTIFHLQFANMADYSGVLLKQAYFQGVRGKPIHLKAGSDKLTSVAIPFAFVGTTFAMIFRGMWHMTHGTGKLKWHKHCSHEDDDTRCLTYCNFCNDLGSRGIMMFSWSQWYLVHSNENHRLNWCADNSKSLLLQL